MSTAFIPGLKLCEQFYREAVHPILTRHFPDLKHAAASLAAALMFWLDDGVSADHHWGPRVVPL
jgi:hypothetical protein